MLLCIIILVTLVTSATTATSATCVFVPITTSLAGTSTPAALCMTHLAARTTAVSSAVRNHANVFGALGFTFVQAPATPALATLAPITPALAPFTPAFTPFIPTSVTLAPVTPASTPDLAPVTVSPVGASAPAY